MAQKLKNITIYDVLMYIAILFSGTDIWSFNIGVNIRFIQILYVVILLIYIIKYKPIIKWSSSYFFIFILIFIINSIISTIFSLNFMHSFLYFTWIIYSVLILIPMFYIYIKNVGVKKLKIIFRAVAISMFLLIIFQFLLDGILKIELPIFSSQHFQGVTRVALWFYEPSYLATFMSIFVSFFSYYVFIRKEYYLIPEFIASVISLLLTTSTTGFLIIFVIFLVVLFTRIRMVSNFEKKLIILLIAIIAIFASLLIAALFFRSVFDKFIMRIFNQGITAASGDRMNDYGNQIRAFFYAPLFGVGLDCYGVFVGDPNIVASNITLELLATMGIFGMVSFYAIIVYLFYETFLSIRAKKYNFSRVVVFSTIILLVALQANQNFMRVYLWMMISISYGAIVFEKNIFSEDEIKENNEEIIKESNEDKIDNIVLQ